MNPKTMGRRGDKGFGVAEFMITVTILVGIAGAFSAFSHVILKSYGEMVTQVSVSR